MIAGKLRPFAVLATASAIAAGLSIVAAAGAGAAPVPTGGLAASAGMAAGPAPVSSAGASVTAGDSGEIRTSAGCVTDDDNRSKAGTEVVIRPCLARRAAQKWTVDSDGTIRVHGRNGELLSAAAGGAHLVQLAARSGSASRYAQWFVLADGTLVNQGLSADAAGAASASAAQQSAKAPALYVLDDPHQKVAGTVLVVSKHTGLSRQSFTVPGTRLASSKLSNRPDSGFNAGNWALDQVTRRSSVTFLGGSAGSYAYEGSIADQGSFVTVAGNNSPGVADVPMGDSLTGSMSGTWGFRFSAAALSKGSPPTTASGNGPIGTQNWPDLFFPAKATTHSADGSTGSLNSGPQDWAWSYISVPDNCGKAEHWIDADSVGNGMQDGDGDITAPAAGSCS